MIKHECEGCRAVLRPKEGDCYVFCSYALDPCPSATSPTAKLSEAAEE